MSKEVVTNPAAASAPQLLTTKEASEVLRISMRTFWELVSEGRLPVVRYRGVVRVDLQDVLALIDASKIDMSKKEE